MLCGTVCVQDAMRNRASNSRDACHANSALGGCLHDTGEGSGARELERRASRVSLVFPSPSPLNACHAS